MSKQDLAFENHFAQPSITVSHDTSPAQPNANPQGILRLFSTSRFAPFFWTQFLGAFNDNVFKNALMLIIAFQTSQQLSMAPDMVVNLAAGLFILPFFLFSAMAGQMADKMEKSFLTRTIKFMEILIMTGAAIALWMDSLFFLLALLFLMGTQSAFFGPVKYSIMPEHLKETEIVGGNALVEMGTFLAILLGTLCGGLLVQMQEGPMITGGVLVAVAIGGWIASRGIPVTGIAAPGLTIRWNVLRETLRTIGFARRERSVFLSILGISWFWLLGAAYLTQLPNFTRQVLGGGEGVVTLLLTLFSIGVGGGSLLCERLSHKKVELGLVPLGSIGLSIFGFDLFWSCRLPDVHGLMSVAAFLKASGSLRLMLDFVMIGVCGGVYIVPLYAMVQMRTRTHERARVIAANNIINALFMVIAAVLGAVALGAMGMSIPAFFLALALSNAAVAVYIYSLVPEFAIRFLVWMITHTMYRFRHQDLDRIPATGAAVLVCNHVSYMDALLIIGACRRPVRFVMLESIYHMPVLNFVFRAAGAIPIDSHRSNPAGLKKAFKAIASTLDKGEVVCIFPEGHLTLDGHVDVFRPGIERIVKQNPVPVIPLALKGLWGSFFSHKNGKAMARCPQRFWSHVQLLAGWPVSPERVTAEGLRHAVLDLHGDRP
ncbi:phospholipid/glycerol acyltransferase [Desulfosarcina variabilis str. Montpellier]|uniref:MFS transporter n=1 Tax=Desulfosarcina variabilis TaxID=2300 RepID=UPI003AFB01CF